MNEYYPILDVKYWAHDRLHSTKEERYETLKIISLALLALLLWFLAGTPGVNHSRELNVTGAFFALWSLVADKRSPNFRN